MSLPNKNDLKAKLKENQATHTRDSSKDLLSLIEKIEKDEASAEEVYKNVTNEHRGKIFRLIVAEVETKSKLRERTYKRLWSIFLVQLIGSIVFLLASIYFNLTQQKSVVSDELLIAVVITLTGSFLSFLGVAHKYIFSSSKELFDYANKISWSDIDDTHE